MARFDPYPNAWALPQNVVGSRVASFFFLKLFPIPVELDVDSLMTGFNQRSPNAPVGEGIHRYVDRASRMMDQRNVDLSQVLLRREVGTGRIHSLRLSNSRSGATSSNPPPCGDQCDHNRCRADSSKYSRHCPSFSEQRRRLARRNLSQQSEHTDRDRHYYRSIDLVNAMKLAF
jgi:hypothetical protein